MKFLQKRHFGKQGKNRSHRKVTRQEQIESVQSTLPDEVVQFPSVNGHLGEKKTFHSLRWLEGQDARISKDITWDTVVKTVQHTRREALNNLIRK